MDNILELSTICTERGPARSGQRERLLALLAAGAAINADNKNGVSALHYAVRFRSVISVLTFIGNGADVNRACKRIGSTPLHSDVTSSVVNKLGRKPADYVMDEDIKGRLKMGRATGSGNA